MTLIIRRPWTRQSLAPVGLSAEARAAGFLDGMLPWSDWRTIGASATIVGTAQGLAHKSASSATGIVKRPTPPLGTAAFQYIGFLTVFRTTTTTVNAVVGALGSEAGSSGNTLFNVYLTGASNANVTFVFGGSGSNQNVEITGVNLNDGVVHSVLVIAGPWTSGVTTVIADVYIDGRRASSSSFAAYAMGIANAYTWAMAGGFRRGGTDGVYTTQGDVEQLAIVPLLRWSPMPQAEGLAITRNPWALFASERRIFPASVAAGGGGDITVALSGSSVLFSLGSFGLGSSVPLSGAFLTSAAGTLAPSSAIALSGSEVTTSAGTITPSTTIALSGTEVTTIAGTIIASGGGNVTVALAGEAVSTLLGTLIPSVSVALTGDSSTVSAGTLIPGQTIALSGASATISTGTISLSSSISLSGSAVSVLAGTLSVAGSVTITLKAGSWIRYKKLN